MMTVVPSIPNEYLRIYAEIYAERQRQLAKWGRQHRALGTGGKSWQNRADKAKERCDAQEIDSSSDDVTKKATWLSVYEEEFCEAMAESEYAKLRTELIQSAAVAVAIIEDIEEHYAPELSERAIYVGANNNVL